MAGQDLRSFVDAYGRAHPGEVIRVTEPVSIEEDVMALVLEYERRRRFPILLFEKVVGHDIPIVCNAVASRRALAFALGVVERALAAEYARRIKDYVKPVVVPKAPFGHRMLTGAALDLAKLPMPLYFPGDAGRYLTAGMLVARDPETGVETEGYHRFQLKGPDRMGVSLHSRRRMFEYQRRAEAKGKALPCAVVLGLHPLVSMGSLAYPPPDVGKFEVVGGLLGEPLEVAPCSTIDLHVPAAAEIVIEGEILPGVREPEGPFGEFTGYFSRRSTEHVFVAKAIAMREKPWFQSIGSGRAGDHITTLGLIREAEITNALARVIPNVRGGAGPAPARLDGLPRISSGRRRQVRGRRRPLRGAAPRGAVRDHRPLRARRGGDRDRGRDPRRRAGARGAVRRVHRVLLPAQHRARLRSPGAGHARAAVVSIDRVRARR